MTKRKSFTSQFKIDAVRLVTEQGYRVTEDTDEFFSHLKNVFKRQQKEL
jgi:hypothetical protein